ncbi:MAG TPA: addiction module antidote protein [Burkholderiales bacterium]|nr:addiction module antidote protein [Burkholderiales bacterium]
MSKENKIPAAVPYDDWLYAKLADPEFAAGYLNACMEEGDQPALMRALRQVAKARKGGVAGLARDTGLSRVTLTRALSETGNPELRSLNAVLAASGLKLAVLPATIKRPKGRVRAGERHGKKAA